MTRVKNTISNLVGRFIGLIGFCEDFLKALWGLECVLEELYRCFSGVTGSRGVHRVQGLGFRAQGVLRGEGD